MGKDPDIVHLNSTTMTITAKSPKQVKAIEYLLKTQDHATYESHLDGEIQVVKYSPAGAYPVAVIFSGKRGKSDSHYRYSSEERRDEAIQEKIESVLAHQRWKAKRKEEAKAKKAELEESFKVGDILYTSWGYEQTNIDFYVITKRVGKSTVEYKKIGSKQGEVTSWCSAYVSPDLSYQSEETYKGRITQYGVTIGRETGWKTSVDSKHHASWGY